MLKKRFLTLFERIFLFLMSPRDGWKFLDYDENIKKWGNKNYYIILRRYMMGNLIIHENQALTGCTRNVEMICTVFLNDPSSRGDSANQKAITRNQRHLKPGFNFFLLFMIFATRKPNLYWLNTEASTKYPAVPFLTRLKITEGQKLFFSSNTQILLQILC